MSPAVLTLGVLKLEKALPASSRSPLVTAAVAGASGQVAGSQRKIPVVERSGGATEVVVVLDVEVVVALLVVTLLDVVLVELVEEVLVEVEVVTVVEVTPVVVATNATCPTSEIASVFRSPP